MHPTLVALTQKMYWPQFAARPGRIPSVQILRALAALLVVTGHALYEARAFDASGIVARIAALPVWTFGVDLFFVLSGFIMMWTFGERFGRRAASRDFLGRRLQRIVPLYWFFTGLMIAATLLVPARLETAAFSVEHAFLSLLFIPHIAPQGGFHPILSLGWTLMYEMFFYLAFALALFLPRRTGLAALTLLFAVLYAVASLSSVLPVALQMFWGDTVLFEFLLGVLFYFIQKEGRLTLVRLAPLLLVCASIGFAAMRGGIALRLFQSGIPALGVFGLFFWMLPEVKLRAWVFLVLVGEASYTLYLSHPFVLEAVKIAFTLTPLPSTVQLGLFLPSAIVAAIAFSLVFYARVDLHLARRSAAATSALWTMVVAVLPARAPIFRHAAGGFARTRPPHNPTPIA